MCSKTPYCDSDEVRTSSKWREYDLIGKVKWRTTRCRGCGAVLNRRRVA